MPTRYLFHNCSCCFNQPRKSEQGKYSYPSMTYVVCLSNKDKCGAVGSNNDADLKPFLQLYSPVVVLYNMTRVKHFINVYSPVCRFIYVPWIGIVCRCRVGNGEAGVLCDEKYSGWSLYYNHNLVVPNITIHFPFEVLVRIGPSNWSWDFDHRWVDIGRVWNHWD